MVVESDLAEADSEGDLIYRYLHFVKKLLEFKESILTINVN